MIGRRVASLGLVQVSSHLERGRDWAPENCIECPRKRGLIANDRCLELQASEHCHCTLAATSPLRDQVRGLERQERESRRAHRSLILQGVAAHAPRSRVLVGIHGKKGHGKSTIAAHLVARHGFVRTRFAAPLKELIGARVFGMTEAQTDGFLKEAPCVDLIDRTPIELAHETAALLSDAWNSPLSTRDRIERWTAIYTPLFDGEGRLHTPRAIMQAIGGGARTHIAQTFWIDLWRDTLRRTKAARVVVDDVRYPDEKRTIEQAGGQVWRSVRADLPPSLDEDPSETACDQLPDQSFAVVLRRAGGVPEMLAQLDGVVGQRLPPAPEEGP